MVTYFRIGYKIYWNEKKNRPNHLEIYIIYNVYINMLENVIINFLPEI